MNETFKVLIADDEKEIIKVLRLFLEKEGIEVFEAYDGEMAYMVIERNEIDLAILDVMMPHMNGFDLIKKIRQEYDIPVIFLTAKIQLDNKVLGLNLGADDYITKPFEPLEVVARVKSNLRRNSKLQKNVTENDDVIIYKNLQLNLSRCQLNIGDDKVNLTKTELALLEMFMRNPGRVFTKEKVYQAGWEGEYIVDDNVIRVTISRLRDKIGEDKIKTIRGLGYRLEL